MPRNRKCILCETVHASKQEMDEHMRSMLHHRELEKVKGRDCGHECRVCKMTVVSLTDYAAHISSPLHKQNVEAAEKKPSGNDYEEDYFDQALVDLLEKRKEAIRKEKEAAAAKLAKKEAEERRVEELKQKIKDAKERYEWDSYSQQPSQGFTGSNQQDPWYRGKQYNAIEQDTQPWHSNSNHGKSATWHAQKAPNLYRWSSAEFSGGSLHNQGHYNNWPNDIDERRNRLPWLSNGGSSNGIYGRNNISQYPQRGRPASLLGPPPLYPPPPSFFSQTLNPNSSKNKGPQQADGPPNGDEQSAEPDHNNSNKCPKAFGSNPKLDKTCRWSPYPVSKGLESVPHKEGNSSNSLEKYTKVPKPKKQDKSQEATASNRQSRPEHKPEQSNSSRQSVPEKGKHKKSPKDKAGDRSSSGSRGSSLKRDELQNATSSPSDQKTKKPLQQKDRRMSSSMSGLNSGALLSKGSSQQSPTQTKSSTAKQSGLGSQTQAIHGPLQSRQERQLPESLRHARQLVLEKRASLDLSSKTNRKEMALHIVEEHQKRDHQQNQLAVNKENSCGQNAAKLNLPDLIRPERPTLQSPDSSQFLQSLQVSTSTMESSEPAASCREDDDNRRKSVKETCQTEAQEEAMQEGGEAQMASGSNTASLSKLDLPPVLKRDLTKHISSHKGKTGTHEPNLNIARRVRNVSESRRSDSEKDSGLKPTVRQLISSSGSRRNVNWDQVYQEVRKKQDKGKGMPRFGIEMVQCEQEDHSQEEDDIPILEGFQWESLMDPPSPTTSRKRSLSESSIAPHSLFTPFTPTETTQIESLGSEQQESSVSPKITLTQEKKDNQRQKEVEQMLGQLSEVKVEKQPETLQSATVKALQRSDSMLEESSGTELLDAQGTGKRRRAAGDVPSAEASSLEHNNKRRKVKSKKERSQIDQLLAVSLREDELSRSLQTVDTGLIQARAALEAAYMEVQRLMVAKQQMTGEMSTLRNKRIELLKGMQGSLEETPQIKLKEEKIDLVEAERPHMLSPVTLPTVPDVPAAPSPILVPVNPPSPPLSRPAFTPLVIKQEPLSPVHVSAEPDPVEEMSSFAQSMTVELPVMFHHAATPSASPAASPKGASETPAELALHFQSSPAPLFQTKTEERSEHFGMESSPSHGTQMELFGAPETPTEPALNFQPSPERQHEPLFQIKTERLWENFGTESSPPPETQLELSGAPETMAEPPPTVRSSPERKPDRLPITNTLRFWENLGGESSPSQETQWELLDAALNFQASPRRKKLAEHHQTNTAAEHHWENFAKPADCKESLSSSHHQLVETTDKIIQTTNHCLLPDSKSSIQLLHSRRSSESFVAPSVPSPVLNLPSSPSELRSGKRVRKLKKRKVLNKTQGAEQLESSDTEVDSESLRQRCPRPRRRSSASSQVSCSTQQTDDRDGDANMAEAPQEDTRRQLFPVSEVEKVQARQTKNKEEIPKVNQAGEIANPDSEDCMEVTEVCQEAHEEAPAQASTIAQKIPKSSRPQTQSLACNEVSSTSDMEICKSSESEMPFPLKSPNLAKTSSDASSDHEHSEDDRPTEGAFEGHQEAVNAMQIHNGLLYTCSGDRTVKAFDVVSHKCVGVFEGHTSKVSCLLVSAAPCLHHRLYSGSSDQTIRCYNLKTRELEHQFLMSDRVLCLHSRWKMLYAGLANGTVVTFNLKSNKQMDVFECHTPRAVSCLASSQERNRRILLVGSYDRTISVRDAKTGLLLRTLDGHTKTVLCMKVVDDLVFSGSSDHCVYAHNIRTGELVQVYKGHSHAVTVVAILGQVMVTACLDKMVHVHDLLSHDQLQVYGGHKDMVMCMAIHKTMCYTGCYDGSVQAVKLNLLQNYRCWWQGCPLVFGVLEDLQQHLSNDHANVNVQTLKCRWRSCEEFFCARNSSKQGMLMHMKKHIQEEFELET